MTRRVLDVAIRSEFKKGFGDIAKSFSGLQNTLKGVEKSVNKLANNIDRQLTFKQAQLGAKKLADNQRIVNKEINSGIQVAKRYESAHTALGNKLAAVANAQKSGHVSQKQRLEAEIGLLNQYIKKTGDLSVMQNKGQFRDSRGRFVAFTKASVTAVSNDLAKSVEQGITKGATKGSNVVVAQMRATSSRIRGAVERIGASGYQSGFSNRNNQAAYYDALWGSQGKRPGTGLGTQALINRNTGVRSENTSTGLLLGDDARFNQLKLQYQKLEQAATTTHTRIRRMNFGPNPANSESAFKRLIDSYNRLGFTLFQLQATAMTIFGLSGIGAIVQQADAFITLQNQVARTSDSLDDLGANMKDVFRISRETFADPKVVGNMYSRINKYSETLGLNREQVGGVTQAISGAFAASPGNANEKAASMYQFMQGFQSNRMGGDELRSVLEMAPYVGDILGKGIAKLRGMPEGSVIDLRAQAKAGTPINTKELAAVFSDPSIQKEIKETLGRQSRTFGDLLMVGKTRLMEMTQQFMRSTGAFSGIINSLSQFLTNDEKFAKFTQALEAATISLLTYGGMLAGGAAVKGAGNVVRGLGARAGFGRNALGIVDTVADAAGNATAKRGVGQFGNTQWGNIMSNADFNRMYAEAQNENRSRSGRRGLGGNLKAAGGAVSAGAEVALLGLGRALTAVQTPGKAASSVIQGVGNSYKAANTAVTAANAATVASMGRVAAQGRTGSVLLRGVGTAFATLGRFLAPVVGLATSFSIPLIVIASVIALLVMRFNKLLGAMTGGMNIMDILLGLWDKLARGMEWVAGKIDQLSGGLFSGLGRAIDYVLGKLAFLAKEDSDFQRRQANRQAGSAMFGGKAGVLDKDGNIVQARVNEARPGQRATVSALAGGEILVAKKDVTDSHRAAAFRNGQWLMNEGVDPALPTGGKAGLPAETKSGDDKKNKGPKDPWPEFLRDLKLKVQSVLDLRNVAPQFADIQSELNENFRRAMDVLNFDSSGFATLTEAWAAFSNTNAAKAAQVNQQNEALKREKLVEATREFVNTLNDSLISASREARKAGMGDLQGRLYDNLNAVMDEFVNNNPSFIGDRNTFDSIKAEMASGIGLGQINGSDTVQSTLDRILATLNGDARDQFETQLQGLNSSSTRTLTNADNRANRLSFQALETQGLALSRFGQQREVQEEINKLTADFVDKYGEGALLNENLNGILKTQIQLVKDRNAQMNAYNSNWKNGFGEAIAEYGNGLANIAAATKDVFTNALKGVEDGLVSMMTATDLKMDDVRQGIADILRSIQTDISRMFIQQLVMKPINNWIKGIGEKLFGIKNEDQTIQAQNVYINSTPLGQLVNGGGWMGGASGPFEALQGMVGGGSPAQGGGGAGWLKKGMSMIGNFLPGPLNVLSKVFSLFHEGGTVGYSTMSRAINPSVFQNAKRYHTGTMNVGLPALGANEVPAILKQGEKVLTASQYHAMNSGSSSTSFAPTIAINYTAAPSSGNGQGANPEEHAAQISRMVTAAVNEQIMKYDQRQSKPGSPGYLNKKR